MSLIPHDPAYRRLWMIPRNKRWIPPIFLTPILELITANPSFSGDQEAQNKFAKSLEIMGLKRVGVQYHSHSGGPRTYVAQMRALGLIFNYEGNLHLTIAGEAMVRAERPLLMLQLNLLRHQYPSAYSQGPNVRIHPAIKVKPFLFLIELMRMLEYLTNDEIAVAVVYGHNISCLDICIEKILRIRAGAGLEDVIGDWSEDLSTTRSGQSTLEIRLRDVRDIANTFKNYICSACLAHESEIGDGQNVITTNPQFSRLIDSEKVKMTRFIPLTSEMQFQRSYGRGGKTKDNRSLARPSSRIDPNVVAIQSQYRMILSSNFSIPDDEIVAKIEVDFGVSRGQIEGAIGPLQSQRLSFFESEYYKLSTGGTATAIGFERATVSLINELGLHIRTELSAEHTGQRPRSGLGGFSDILVRYKGNKGTVIDAKAISNYCLPADHLLKMAEIYVPSFEELLDAHESRDLRSVGYVPASVCTTIDSRLRLLTERCELKSFILDAPSLFKMTLMHDPDSFLQLISGSAGHVI